MSRTSYYMPAEWELQSGVQLTWPHAATDWAPYLDDITRTYLELTAAIARHELVVIAAQHPDEVGELLRSRLGKELFQRVVIHPCPNNDTWARDHAFITLLHKQSPTAKALLLDFRFNGWGEKFAADKDNAINRTLHQAGAYVGEYRDHNDFVLEGGSIESDGHGTILTTSQCLLAPHRNQPLAQADIEQRLKQMLCADRILWLDHGNLIGDDTDGHVDTIARFAPDDTILYVSPGNTEDEQYADFLALEAQLRQLRTADGRPYHLIPLPMPEPIYDGPDRLPATYANFLVINGAVVVPTYNQPEADRAAINAIASAFPGRDIIPIDARTIIRQHGSIHCITMQYPAGVVNIKG